MVVLTCIYASRLDLKQEYFWHRNFFTEAITAEQLEGHLGLTTLKSNVADGEKVLLSPK